MATACLIDFKESLRKLAGISDAQELRRAIEAMCATFGPIKFCRLMYNENRKEYLCLVELQSANLHSAMIQGLGGDMFGDCVAFNIPNSQ